MIFHFCIFVFISFSFCYESTIIPKIIRIFPHTSKGYTQGLLVKNDTLIEGTGLFNESKLYIISLQNGNILAEKSLATHFGEGISFGLNNKLYQLTWKSQKVFIWSYPTLNLQDSMEYPGEGWGLTKNKHFLIMSNGSDTLFFRDQNFKHIKTLKVTINGKPLHYLNELEYAHESIYANVYQTYYIVKINPTTGIVTDLIDCQNLLNQDPAIKKYGDVLNGIAYNSSNDHFYLTGKHWDLIFEVEIPHRIIAPK